MYSTLIGCCGISKLYSENKLIKTSSRSDIETQIDQNHIGSKLI